MGGTYTLVISLPEPVTIEVGALGAHELLAGWYAYTGSAFGPGGFSRIDRHRELAGDERETRHWHIDYLLGHDATRIERAIRTPELDVECTVARALPGPGSRGSARRTVRVRHTSRTPRTARRCSKRSSGHTKRREVHWAFSE